MYSSDYDEDYYVCENCGRKSYPEVGMNTCPCKPFGSKAQQQSDKDELTTVDPALLTEQGAAYLRSINSYPKRYPVIHPVKLPKSSREISYAFVQHQTEKAILFAIEDNLGLRSQWVPKSVITAHSEPEKRVTIQSWFLDRADL